MRLRFADSVCNNCNHYKPASLPLNTLGSTNDVAREREAPRSSTHAKGPEVITAAHRTASVSNPNQVHNMTIPNRLPADPIQIEVDQINGYQNVIRPLGQVQLRVICKQFVWAVKISKQLGKLIRGFQT